ncbi:hypothetical protein Tco_1254440 [Tanacetum coccineum]
MSELTTCQNGITGPFPSECLDANQSGSSTAGLRSQEKIDYFNVAVSLDKEVFDVVMLVKRLGRDLQEGKRRQFSYIGRLLRDVEPELIDGLMKATKDGDMQKFQEFLGSDKSDLAEVSEVEEESEDEDEGLWGRDHSHDIGNEWFNGLVNKDAHKSLARYTL